MMRLTYLFVVALTVCLFGVSADDVFAQQEQTHAAKSDTVSCWHFEDDNFNSTGGVAFKGIASAPVPPKNHVNPAGLVNNATTTLNNPSPAGGRSLLLDGDGDYLEVGNPHPATGSYTKTMWVRRAGANVDSSWENLYTSGDEGGPHAMLIAPPSAGTILHVYHRGGTGKGLAPHNTRQPIPTNQWVHVAVVYDSPAGTLTTYYNGTAVDSTEGIGTLGPMKEKDNIGAYARMQSWFNGQLDDVCVFDQALSASQINTMANPTVRE